MAGRDGIPQLPLQSPVGSGHGGQATTAISGQLMKQEERNCPFLETHRMPGLRSALCTFRRKHSKGLNVHTPRFEAQICLTRWGLGQVSVPQCRLCKRRTA